MSNKQEILIATKKIDGDDRADKNKTAKDNEIGPPKSLKKIDDLRNGVWIRSLGHSFANILILPSMKMLQ